ncbi:MAG TPA: YicC family protein [Gammaproteobacteria bacterium]|nr:YicC family protein [Gammaproteobacteria bacterium]
MISSMTGFARAELESETGKLTIELRSVNHRYLDLSVRMPDVLRRFETRVREILRQQLSRGKVECNIHFAASASPEGLLIDEARARALIQSLEQVRGWIAEPAPVTAETVLNWPGVISEDLPDEKAMLEALESALGQALDRLTRMRREEGERLRGIIESRLEKVADTVKSVRRRRPDVLARVRQKLLDRLAGLDAQADPGRLEQELAFIAQKLDVDEELDRLDSHVQATRETLHRPEAIGRRLDFIMQEFNREANTLSAKSADAETTAAAVELKVLIEQMREQVQNIE